MMINVNRNSTESQMAVSIAPGPLKSDYRKHISTPLPFLNHMIEHIVWRCGLNITCDVKTTDFYLTHVVSEDLGITLGKAVAEYIRQNIASGLAGYASGVGMIDEARALCAISFENRAYLDFECKTTLPAQTEGMLSEDILTFIEGFVQGACCTLHISIEKGENGHHIWEAAYRGLGIAIGEALAHNPSRSGMTSGVAGQIEFIVE